MCVKYVEDGQKGEVHMTTGSKGKDDVFRPLLDAEFLHISFLIYFLQRNGHGDRAHNLA